MSSKGSNVRKKVSATTPQVASDTISSGEILLSSPQTLLMNNPKGVDPVMVCLRQEIERARTLSRDPEIKSCSLGFRK